MEILIQLSLSLVGGLLMSRLAKLLNLPAVTAYLVCGLLLGPYLLGALDITGIGFTTPESVSRLDIISQTALGFIAFTIGNEFRVAQLKAMGRQAITVGIFQAVFTTALVDAALVALHFANPELISISSAITLGAIAAATAPAATLMVVRQYKADGPLTKLLLLVVAIDDAVGLVLFSASFGVASALESGAISILTVLVEPVVEIVLSLALGGFAGWVLYRVEKYFHSRSKRLSISIGFVLLTVGLSMAEFEAGGVRCGFSLLLVCMMTGTVFCNICDFSEELMSRVDGWTAPLFVLFFVLSGAELNLGILANPLVLLIGAVYIISRSLGKYLGSYASCAATGCSEKITRHLGITLLPQAGVALGMALTAQQLAGGAVVRSVVLFSVLVYELVGPALTKRSLIAAGEIRTEGKTNARQKNPPTKPVNLNG
jgi:Kef-type K+ transport system membrane component KefB